MTSRVVGSPIHAARFSSSVWYFFFFKQKTAYEMSECDWSSDVCSSDLEEHTSDLQSQAEDGYEISECDWSSDVCSSDRSEEHTSELQSHSEISYAVFCLKKKIITRPTEFLNRKGIERVRCWIEDQTGSLEVRGGDYSFFF